MIELSRHVFEALRKDEEFILYRGRSGDDASQAAPASRLGSKAVEASENRGRDVGLRRDFDELSRVAQSSRLAKSGRARARTFGCGPRRELGRTLRPTVDCIQLAGH